MQSDPSGATSSRIPYRHHSSPSSSPSDNPTAPVWSALLRDDANQQNGASSSKTSSPPKRSSSPAKDRQRHPLSNGASRRQRRLWRSARKAATYLVLLGLLLLALDRFAPPTSANGSERLSRLKTRILGRDPADDVCHFVSPVEAYHRDLRRLRRKAQQVHGHPPPRQQYGFDSPSRSRNHTHSHHTFSPNGLLYVSPDPDAPHPIPTLLNLGEQRWEELLARQSTTLEEAVEEYESRYGRRPPRGFDLWWDFAQAHNLVLPDEYDRINLDLAPFFALPKEEMKRRMLMVEQMPETFSLVVNQGKVDVQILDPKGLEWDGTWPRARDAAALVESFARYLPADLKATFSIFDQPQVYLSWARRGSLVELGLKNRHTTHLQETDNAEVRLTRSCPPTSEFRSENASSTSGHSFIYDPLEASDLCDHPYLAPKHGLTIEPHDQHSHPRPHTQLLPLFSLAKTSINSDILVTPLDQFFDNPGKDPKWEDKKSRKLAWRGSPTGISMMTSELPWRQAHRIRLHQFATNQSHRSTSFMVPTLGTHAESDDQPLEAHMEAATARQAADFFFDMKLAGEPLQCSEDDGTCNEMWQEIDFAGFQRAEDLNEHKFLFDIDGNGWSGRFRRLMRTNSVVIKSTLFTEWFQPHLIPWFMYIPSKLDYTDLTDILAFFRGSPEHPDMGFDETAKAIASNGKCFAERMFRLQDLQAYMMRLFLEYARLAADEGIDMDLELAETTTDYDDANNDEDYDRIRAFAEFQPPGESDVDDGASVDQVEEISDVSPYE